MASAPHFSAAWLEAYRRRVGAPLPGTSPATGRGAPAEPAGNAPAGRRGRPASRRAPARAQEGPENAPRNAPRDPGAELCPYAPDAAEVPLRGWDGRQTETERRYNAEVLGGAGRFEAVSLRLPGGGRYTPDFMTVEGGVATFHEVKGAYRLPSQGRAWTAFREAAAAFPLWRFVWAAERARGDGGGFSTKVFNSAAMGEGAT